MDFNDLNAFYFVAKQESYSRAATELRIAQSALSRRVARLEHQLGIKLLEKSGRGVSLTDEGTALFLRAEGLMQELTSIKNDLLAIGREPSGDVRVAMPPTTGKLLAPLIVGDCRSRCPRINIQIKEGVSGFIHELLVADQIDLALLYNPEKSRDYELVPLLHEPLYLIAPRTGELRETLPLDKGRFNLALLPKVPLILPGKSHGMRRLLERLATDQGLSLNVAGHADGLLTTLGMVAAGLGFTIFSYAGVYEDVESGAVEAIAITPEISWDLTMAHRRGTRNYRAIVEVRRSILHQLQTLVQRGMWRGRLIATET